MTNRESNKEAEPVAWRWKIRGGIDAWHWSAEKPSFSPRDESSYVFDLQPLFTSPQQDTEGREITEGWQPIETAPKDGTEFQAWAEHASGGVWLPQCRINPDNGAFEIWGRVDYDIDGWDLIPHLIETHWMPLPEPPRAERPHPAEGS
jgi:hypothetical protein